MLFRMYISSFKNFLISKEYCIIFHSINKRTSTSTSSQCGMASDHFYFTGDHVLLKVVFLIEKNNISIVFLNPETPRV